MTPAELREARLTLGLTQAQLASVMGYGATIRISEIERGVRGVSEQTARLMRAYLNGYRPDDWPEKQKPPPA